VSLRLFVALDLPETARAALAGYRDAVADPAVWRPVGEGAFHVTLAFLGRCADDDAARVAALLPDAAAAPALRVAGALLLPPRGARVLTVALEDRDGTLGALQARVGADLAAAGLYVPERRPFRPHVTLARLRAGARAPRALAVAPPPLAFAGTAVTLYRSDLARSGATYVPLAVRPLGSAAA
jgi:RNA 2',3'-cyclic 3'-phosphodiesterase